MPLRVLFIAAEDEENLSVRYPAASLAKSGHTPGIAPFSDTQDTGRVLQQIRQFHPALVAVSIAFQSRAPAFFSLIRAIREAGFSGYITAGGHFPTFEYREILRTQPGIDSIVRFEGEQALCELAECLEGNRHLFAVSNLVFRNAGDITENPVTDRFPDLDSLPFPVRNSRPQVRLGENFATLIASRGCWHSACAYCCIGAFHARKKDQRHALRSVENIARELAWLYREQGVRLFQFHDDNFLQAGEEENCARLDGLMAALEGEGFDCGSAAFLIKARPDSITAEVGARLAELGVVGVFLGVENASATGLSALIRGSAVRDIGRAFGILKRHRIIVTYNLLMFHPKATLDEINTNILFIKEHSGYPFDFGRAEIVAGSPLERQVIRDGLRQGNWPNWDYRIEDGDVDRMFRISLATFRRPDSGYSRLAHSLIALAYGSSAAQRLCPGPAAEDMGTETGALITKSTGFVLDQILKMYALTATESPMEELDRLAGSVHDGCTQLSGEAEALMHRMHRIQHVERMFRKAGVAGAAQHSPLLRWIFRI